MKRIGCILLIFILALGMLPLQARAVELDTAGKSCLLMDVATGTILYERNAHEPLAPASVTKVMTMLLIMEAIDGRKIGWDGAPPRGRHRLPLHYSTLFFILQEQEGRTMGFFEGQRALFA